MLSIAHLKPSFSLLDNGRSIEATDGLAKICSEIAHQKWPCTFLRIDLAEFAVTANSSRVNPQHNKLTLMAAPFPA